MINKIADFMFYVLGLIVNAYRSLYISMGYRGLVTPNPNHLFGQRRYYTAPVATGQTLLEIIKQTDGLIYRINQMHYQHEHVLVLAAVVDDEIRVNAYPVIYEDYCTNYVGLDDPHTSGVSSFLFSRTQVVPNRKMSVQHILLPDRARKYNQYEPEFSWKQALGDMDECVLHRDMYRPVHV